LSTGNEATDLPRLEALDLFGAQPSPQAVQAPDAATPPVTTSLGTYKAIVLEPPRDQDRCLAFLRGGATFCLKRNCPSASHESASKQDLGIKGIVVVQRNTYTAFRSLVLQVDSVDDKVLAELVSDSHPLVEWTATFATVHSATDETDAQVGLPEVRRAHADMRAAISFVKTPGRGAPVDFELETFSAYKPTQGRLGSSVSIDSQEPDRSPEILGNVEAALAEAGRVVEKLRSSGERLAENFESAVSLLRKRIDTIATIMGDLDHAGANFEAPTVCEVLGILDAAVSALHSTQQNQQGSLRLQALLNVVELRTTEVEKIVLGSPSPLVALTLAQSTTMVNGKLLPYNDAIIKLGAAQRALLTRISSVEQSVSGAQQGGGNPLTAFDQFGIPINPRSQPAAVETAHFDALSAQVRGIQLDVDKIKASSAGGAIKWMNLGFTNVQEVAAWVTINFDESCFGLMSDALLFLECIAEEREIHQGSAAGRTTKQLKQLKELNLPSRAEARALAVLETPFPRLLYKGEVAMGEKDPSYLTGVPSYDAWSDPLTGLRYRLTSGSLATKLTLQQAISIRMPSTKHSVGASLCRAAAEASTSFIDSFTVFVEDTWISLSKRSKFPLKQAWSLVSMLGARIFQELAEVRRGAFDAVSTSDAAGSRVTMCATVLWAVFRTLDMMDEFVRHKFKDHPAISAEYIKFLAVNSGHETVETIEKSIKTVESKLDEHLKRFAAVQKNADAGADNNKNNLQKFKTLEGQLKTLEGRIKKQEDKK
jgi:hypothetical protein